MIVIQLSDLHIRAPGQAAHRIVEVNALADRALARVAAFRPRPSAVIVTGDVTDCGLPAEYAHAAQMFAHHLAGIPTWMIPGNHDRRENFSGPLGAWCAVTDGFAQFAVEDLPWRIVMLDSVVPGAGHGELCARRLAWLDRTLAAAPGRPTMLALHHPPIVVGIPPMDAIRLRDAGGLAEVLGRYPQVRRIVCGHHHRKVLGMLGGVPVSCCPSTAQTGELELDVRRDGALSWNDGRFLLEPPAFDVHVAVGDELVTHTVLVDGFPGPFHYLDDLDYPGRAP